MPTTDWTTLDIRSTPIEGAADILLIDGDWNAFGPSGSATAAVPAIQRAGFAPELGRQLDMIDSGSRVLVVGIGARASNAIDWQVIGGRVFDAMVNRRVGAARMPGAEVLGGEAAMVALLTGVLLHSYSFDTKRAVPREDFRPEFLVLQHEDAHLIERALAAARPLNRARAYVEEPANLLTPPAWADKIAVSLEPIGITVRVLDPAALTGAGLGGLLSVGRGSEHGSYLVAAEWRGAEERSGWDAAWIGKGLTFDSGGLNLKPRPTIEKMKFDMAGGAAVLAAIELAAMRRARANVVAIVPMADNAIDALAYRPGDVITSASGLTIEVLSTDAEGRIALADAMTWALRNYAPDWMIDVATLTAMAATVLHEEFAAVYSNDDGLAAALSAAGEMCGDHLWRMPLVARQRHLVESSVADVANLGTPGFLGIAGGSPTAAAQFLARFAGATRWAHIRHGGAVVDAAADATHRSRCDGLWRTVARHVASGRD